MWDNLPLVTQEIPCKITFRNSIKSKFSQYDEWYLDLDHNPLRI